MHIYMHLCTNSLALTSPGLQPPALHHVQARLKTGHIPAGHAASSGTGAIPDMLVYCTLPASLTFQGEAMRLRNSQS